MKLSEGKLYTKMDELKEDYVLYRCGQGGSVDRRERKEEYTLARLSPYEMEIKMFLTLFLWNSI